MLEVGRVENPNPDSYLTQASWNRAHFGAWCIVSSPLILGLELTDSKLSNILDVIGNREAVAVNQQWAGHPGFLLDEYDVRHPGSKFAYVWSEKCNSSDSSQTMWRYDATTKTILTETETFNDSSTVTALCLSTDQGSNALVVDSCSTAGTSSDSQGQQQQQQVWDVDSAVTHTVKQGGKCLDSFNGQDCAVDPIGTGRIDMYPCNGGPNQEWFFGANGNNGTITDGCGACLGVKQVAPPGGGGGSDILTKVQIWAKPQPRGAFAVLLINASPETILKPYVLPFDKLNMTQHTTTATVRDIWNREDLGTFTDEFSLPAVDAFDSGFYLITPTMDKGMP
jgi:hypothetical protein